MTAMTEKINVHTFETQVTKTQTQNAFPIMTRLFDILNFS